MIVSHRHGLVFVKTRKTAGTSVEIALSRICGPEDVITGIAPPDEAIRRQRGGRGPQNTLVPLRSMTPRLVYHWIRERRRPHYFTHEPAWLLREVVGRRRWRRYLTFTVERNPWDKAVSLYYWRTRDQRPRPSFGEYLHSVDPGSLSNYRLYADGGGILVDRVLRYEDLPGSLDRLWAEAGLPARPDLPLAKSGHRPADARDYRRLYSPDEVAVVAEVCSREIAAFGYRF